MSFLPLIPVLEGPSIFSGVGRIFHSDASSFFSLNSSHLFVLFYYRREVLKYLAVFWTVFFCTLIILTYCIAEGRSVGSSLSA